MKKILFTLLTLLLLMSCSKDSKKMDISQLENRNGVYYMKNKPYSGKAFEYYGNGNIKLENTYKDGVISGNQIIYYQSGQKQEEGPIKDDMKTDKWLSYYDTGEVQKEAYYKDGKLDGKMTAFSKSGEIEEEGYYRDGVKDGAWVKYSNGEKKEEVVYKDGKSGDESKTDESKDSKDAGNSASKETEIGDPPSVYLEELKPISKNSDWLKDLEYYVVENGDTSILYDLYPYELKIVRNTVYARKGYIFQDKDLKEHFNSEPWYVGKYKNMNDIKLTTREKKFVEIVKKVENQIANGSN